jgi:hypothetical protein
MADITAVAKRAKLAPRREPYWLKIGTASYLGYRCTEAGGTWLVRHYTGNFGKQVYHPLGDLANFGSHAQYDEAKRMAEDWLRHLGADGSNENTTVAGACVRYLKEKQRTDGERAMRDHEARLERRA